MRQFLIAASLFVLFSGIARSQTQQPYRFHSADEYQLVHSWFNKLDADLAEAATDSPAAPVALSRSVLNRLMANWDAGVYDSLQMDEARRSLRALIDSGVLLHADAVSLDGDYSRLLDLRAQYYGGRD